MLRYVLMALALLLCVSVAMALLISALTVLALACVVGIPLWLMTRPHLERHGVLRSKRPIDKLQALYAEGKIDLFEFERRVSHLISIEP